MSSIDLYLHYGGEPRSDVIHRVTYEGLGKKVRDYSAKRTEGDQFEEIEKENYERAGFGSSIS